MTGNLTILILLSPRSCLMMSKSPRSSENYKRLEKPLSVTSLKDEETEDQRQTQAGFPEAILWQWKKQD